MKSFFDFIGRTEIEMCSRLPRNAETGDSDKEAFFASDGGVEVSKFLGGETRQIELRRRLPNSDKRWRA
ncbi:hypothetical protein [Bacillus sp. ISL-37]|uniref:hypothetical protein n=1 Tax=Bacillus sp. ISL-37 TaxID=2819123 RepID=UPI001BE64545|nr:hypothetical protein [Bacillus sp. ISL-37]MBT2683064.1 hypothetical protein [Bacillus sp. ISL-37]